MRVEYAITVALRPVFIEKKEIKLVNEKWTIKPHSFELWPVMNLRKLE